MGVGISRLWSGRAATVADDGPWPRVASYESTGVFGVSDPRIFQVDRRAFCRLWLDAAVRHPGVRKASVDLATATALIEFEPGVTRATMAETFSAAVREALEAPPNNAADRADWVALTGFPGSDSSPWEISGRSPDRFRLDHPGLDADRELRADWLDRLAGADGVTGCRPAWFSDGLTVKFDPALTDENRIIDAALRAWRESAQAETSTRSTHTRSLVSIDPYTRYANLAKAGGAFAMTLVGIAIPGIPTVPFLLATSFYLARSSPRLNEALLNSAIFGPILREWETHQALSPTSKAKLIGLAATILVVTVSVTPIGPVILIPMLLLSLVSFYGIMQLPGLPASEAGGVREIPAPTPAFG